MNNQITTPCLVNVLGFCVTYFGYFILVAITQSANVTIDQFSFDPDVSCKDTVYRDVVRFVHVGKGF